LLRPDHPVSIDHICPSAICYLWVGVDELLDTLNPWDLFFFSVFSLVGSKTVCASFDDAAVVNLDPFSMSSFLSLPFPTIGKLACLFFDIFYYDSAVENSQTKDHLLFFLLLTFVNKAFSENGGP
jgi:hypothetical protein